MAPGGIFQLLAYGPQDRMLMSTNIFNNLYEIHLYEIHKENYQIRKEKIKIIEELFAIEYNFAITNEIRQLLDKYLP